MDRSQKADLVDQLKHVFSETSVVVVTRNHGLTVDQSTDLRHKMRDAGAQFKVAKNRLALLALDGTRTSRSATFSQARPLWRPRPTRSLPQRSRSTSPRRTTSSKSSAEQWVTRCSTSNGIKALAALPSLDELRGTIVGLIQAPASKIARTVAEPGAQLARIFAAYGAKEAA